MLLLCRMAVYLRGAGGFSKSPQPYSYSKHPVNQASNVRIHKSQPFAVFEECTEPSQARDTYCVIIFFLHIVLLRLLSKVLRWYACIKMSPNDIRIGSRRRWCGRLDIIDHMLNIASWWSAPIILDIWFAIALQDVTWLISRIMLLYFTERKFILCTFQLKMVKFSID